MRLEKQVQAANRYSDQEMRKTKQRDGENPSPVVPAQDRRPHEWSEVIGDLEAHY